jgi:hypothetical protein
MTAGPQKQQQMLCVCVCVVRPFGGHPSPHVTCHCQAARHGAGPPSFAAAAASSSSSFPPFPPPSKRGPGTPRHAIVRLGGSVAHHPHRRGSLPTREEWQPVQFGEARHTCTAPRLEHSLAENIQHNVATNNMQVHGSSMLYIQIIPLALTTHLSTMQRSPLGLTPLRGTLLPSGQGEEVYVVTVSSCFHLDRGEVVVPVS